jgi:hypothetical protein
MQLFVAHKNEEKSNTRYFTAAKPNRHDVNLFSAFYFKINETEFKIYDIEVFEDHVKCHIDICPCGKKWRTITSSLKKQTLSFKSLENINEENQLHLYSSKGIDYTLLSFSELKDIHLINNFSKTNSGNFTKAEKEIISALIDN